MKLWPLPEGFSIPKSLEKSDYSLSARWIHTMTGPPLERHFINVVHGRIESFTHKPTQQECYDFGDDAQILPGVLNMHAHLELSQLARPLDVPLENSRRSMAAWVKKLMQFRRSPEYNAASAMGSALTRQDWPAECAVVADIVPPDLDCEAVRQVKDVRLLDFRELIGWIDDTTDLGATKKIDSVRSKRFFGLAPHAPQTVCPALLHDCVKLACEKSCPVTMHLAETPEELEFLQTGGGPLLEMMRKADPAYDPKKVILGDRPWDHLQLLSEAPQALVVHGVFLDDDELKFLAARRETMAVVYCPRSTAYFGDKKYPLKKMLDFGVRVLLGTDSLASTPDLSLANEMKFILENHPDVPAQAVFRLGTVDAAEFLRLDSQPVGLGSLREGGAAKFAFL